MFLNSIIEQSKRIEERLWVEHSLDASLKLQHGGIGEGQIMLLFVATNAVFAGNLSTKSETLDEQFTQIGRAHV